MLMATPVTAACSETTNDNTNVTQSNRRIAGMTCPPDDERMYDD